MPIESLAWGYGLIATQLYGDVSLSNGIGFSPDGRTMYHSDTAARAIRVHRLDDGRTTPAAAIRVDGRPDGLAASAARSPACRRRWCASEAAMRIFRWSERRFVLGAMWAESHRELRLTSGSDGVAIRTLRR